MKKSSLIIVCILSFNYLNAQNLNFLGTLPAYSQTGKLAKKLNYNIYISQCLDLFNEKIANVEYPASDLQLYFQPSLIYLYSPNLNFAVSITYNYQKSNPDVPFRKEWRPWQQATYSQAIGYSKLTHRIRFEERLIKVDATGKWPLTTRVRYQTGLSFPLNGKTLEDKEFYFNCYQEAYFTLTVPQNQIRSALYSEEWLYAGIGYQIPKYGKLEIGPLSQFNVRNVNKDLRNLFLLQILWSTNF